MAFMSAERVSELPSLATKDIANMSRNKPPPQLRSDSCRDTSSVFGNMPSGRKVLSLLNFSSLFVFHVFLFSTFFCSVLHKISRFIQPLFHKYGKGKLPSQQPILNLQSPISQTGTGVLNEGPSQVSEEKF